VTAAYDRGYYAANGQAGDRPALRWYARLVRRHPGPFLDFGCGTGHLLRRLSRLGPATGFEVSAWSAATARATAPGCPVVTDPAALPDAGFGVLTAVHVLEHLDDAAVATALGVWRRVLRPGGRALVVTPDPAGRGHALSGERWVGFDDPTHVNLRPAADWRATLRDAGFTVLREGSDGLWNVPYGRPLGVRYAAPALAQYVSGRLFLPPGAGESAVFILGA
jgi:SAM-dependent methyltransferase